MMISETASEEIGRTDELPTGSTGRSLKRDETEDDIEKVDHIARTHEFFSKDSVIRAVLVVQCVAAILLYGMLNFVFTHFYYFYHKIHLTLPLSTKFLLLVFSPEYFLVFSETYFKAYFEAYPISYPCVYIILHVAIFYIISMPFTGIYRIFIKRKKLFLYYFFATFPQEMVVLLASCFLALAIYPLFQICGVMK